MSLQIPKNRLGKSLACAIVLLCSFSAQMQAAEPSQPAPGTYGCVSSKFSATSGAYEFTPRGSFTLSANGEYSYQGFEQPSKGRFEYNASTGKIAFSGGYLDKGEATPMKGEKSRFYLVTPTLPGNRWTCGLK